MKKIIFNQKIYSFHIDLLGHVNNAVHIRWMEIGRTKLLEAIGMSITEMTGSGVVPVLASTEIHYLLPLFIHDNVRIEMWLSQLKRASAVIEFRFYNQDDDLVAKAAQKGLFFNQTTNRPHRLSPEERASFVPFLDDNSN